MFKVIVQPIDKIRFIDFLNFRHVHLYSENSHFDWNIIQDQFLLEKFGFFKKYGQMKGLILTNVQIDL